MCISIKSPYFFFNYIVLKLKKIFGQLIPDRIVIKALFFFEMGYKLNLRKPVTFNEKLQWLKLYARDPIMTTLVDKLAVKDYVSKIVGSEYVIPTIASWERFEDIDFDELPDQFVLKTTHDSGGVVVIKDKSNIDKNLLRDKIDKSLDSDFYEKFREWPYKNVKRLIIAEKYMEDATGELRDYKFFCFNGKVKALYIATNRFGRDGSTKFDFFDENFTHLPFTNGYPNSDVIIEKPICFERMKDISELLSKDFAHVRVDLYEIQGRVYFGEFTFTHLSGLAPFKPVDWDFIFGKWLMLKGF